MQTIVVGRVSFSPNVFQKNNPLISKRFNCQIPQSTNSKAPIVDFLVTKCGLPSEKAISVSNSNRISWSSIDNPILVLSLLKCKGFTETQITKIVTRRPSVLVLDPHNNLEPKFMYFKSLGFSDSDLVKLFSINPELVTVSLEDRIIRNFDFLKNLIPSKKDLLTAISRESALLTKILEKTVGPNIAVLLSYFVPESNVLKLLVEQPRVLAKRTDRFTSDVDEIKQMGFNLSSMMFIVALHVYGGTDKHTWERKLMVYREFGFTEEEILSLFKKQPRCMMISEEKVRNGLKILMKEMKWDSAYISKYPVVLMCSMAKRIVPRCAVLKILISKGFLEKNAIIGHVFLASEKTFLEKFVYKYKETIPEVLKIYEDSIEFARTEELTGLV